MLNPEEIGIRIKKRQYELKLKQKDIIEITNISKAAMSNYVNGNRIPDTETIYKLSQALKTSIEWILTGKSINENFSNEEKNLIEAYRIAPETMKDGVKKLLDISEISEEKLLDYKIG